MKYLNKVSTILLLIMVFGITGVNAACPDEIYARQQVELQKKEVQYAREQANYAKEQLAIQKREAELKRQERYRENIDRIQAKRKAK